LAAISEVRQPELLAAFFRCGNADQELLEVTDPELRRKRLGEGQLDRVEHIAVEVEILEQTLATLERLGVKTTGPAKASADYVTGWTESETSGGVMYQFLERSRTN
jgi:gluconolactonase